MGWAEKAWDAFRDVLRLQDKVETLNIEVAQLKVAVTILLSQSGIKDVPKLPFAPPSLPGS